MEPNNQAREIQSQTANEICSIGQLLKETREERRLTIAEASAETRIRQIYLKAIEEGNLECLPGEIYKIGFIKSYASFLELNTTEILRRLNLHHEKEIPYAGTTDDKYAVPVEHQRQPNKKTLYLSLIGISGFIALSYVSQYSDSLKASFTRDNLSENLTDAETKSALQMPEQLSLAAEDTASTAARLEQEMAPNSPAIGSKDTGSTAESTVSTTEGVIPSGTGIRLAAIKDSWVQVYNSSKKTVYAGIMHAGDTYDVPDGQVYTLNTGNAGGVKIILDGQETRPLGADGQVLRSINLTASDLQRFY